MGLFGFSDSFGPGIDKNAPRRKGIFLYMEIFFRKFFKLMRANMLYFLVSLPLIVLLFIFMPVQVFIAPLQSAGAQDAEGLALLEIILRIFSTTLFLNFIGSGPASAGYAYILRCFTRETPVWIWSEFWEKFKENFKQSIIVCAIGIIASALMFLATYLYFNMYSSSGNMLFLLLGYLIIIFALTFMLMHTFIYQLIITYECNILTLYKNAMLLTLAKFPLCLTLSAISAVIAYFVSFTFNPIFSIALYFLILYSILRFPLEFYAARTIERLIKPNEDNTEESEEFENVEELKEEE